MDCARRLLVLLALPTLLLLSAPSAGAFLIPDHAGVKYGNLGVCVSWRDPTDPGVVLVECGADFCFNDTLCDLLSADIHIGRSELVMEL